MCVAEKLFLREASYYNYLKQSSCLKIDGVDDAKRFSSLLVMYLQIYNVSFETSAILVTCYLCHFFICRVHWILFKYLGKTKWNYFLCLQLSCGWETFHSL